MPPAMATPTENYPSSPVYYDHNGQAYLMSPTPMGYPSYGQQMVMDPGSPAAPMPMMVDQHGNPLMIDSHGNPLPLMDYSSVPQDASQVYYPAHAMSSPPPMAGPPHMTSPSPQNASRQPRATGGVL